MGKQQSIQPTKLPQTGALNKKEEDLYPHLSKGEAKINNRLKDKPAERTPQQKVTNEQNSDGSAGAFEEFIDIVKKK